MDKTVETRTAPVQSVVVMECRTDLLQPVKYMWTRRGGIVPKDARVNGVSFSFHFLKEYVSLVWFYTGDISASFT